MRVAIHTLGCKVNQYESQAMEELLRARGHSLVPFEAQADVYLINSCTVTATSDKKSRQAVRQARKRAPGALVALCGCYPQVSPEAARQLEADLIGGSGDRRGFLDLLEQLARTREKAVALDDPFRRRVFEPLPAGGLEGRTRAMLKVEDGCTNFCAYCIIPYARGAVRSLPVEQAAAQALQRLTHRGTADIEHTGELALGWQTLTRFDLFTVEEISDVLDDRLKNVRALNGDHREFIFIRHTITSSQRHLTLVSSGFHCTTSYSITVAKKLDGPLYHNWPFCALSFPPQGSKRQKTPRFVTFIAFPLKIGWTTNPIRGYFES